MSDYEEEEEEQLPSPKSREGLNFDPSSDIMEGFKADELPYFLYDDRINDPTLKLKVVYPTLKGSEKRSTIPICFFYKVFSPDKSTYRWYSLFRFTGKEEAAQELLIGSPVYESTASLYYPGKEPDENDLTRYKQVGLIDKLLKCVKPGETAVRVLLDTDYVENTIGLLRHAQLVRQTWLAKSVLVED